MLAWHDQEDEVLLVQWLVRTVHLRYEADAGAENRQMDVRWTPPVDVAPRDVRSRLDRPHRIAAVSVGQQPAEAVEIGIERRVVAAVVDDVRVAPVRVRIPDLDERATNGAKVLVQDTAGDPYRVAEGARPPRSNACEIALTRPDERR